jgi:hypothetical protein
MLGVSRGFVDRAPRVLLIQTTVWYGRPSCRSTILVKKYRAFHGSAEPDSAS